MPKEKQSVVLTPKLNAALLILLEKLSQLGVDTTGKKIIIKDNQITIE